MQQHDRKCFAHRSPTNPLTLGLGSNCQNFTLSEHGHVAYQIKGNHEIQQHYNRRPLPHDPRGWGQTVKFNFFRTWSCCISN